MPIMNKAGVYLQEIDISEVMPTALSPSTGAIVVPSDKGPLKPILVTNETQFLSLFSSTGYPQIKEHYSAIKFLQRSSSLWAVRVHKNATYGAILVSEGSPAYVVNTNDEPYTINNTTNTLKLTIDGITTIITLNNGTWTANDISRMIQRHFNLNNIPAKATSIIDNNGQNRIKISSLTYASYSILKIEDVANNCYGILGLTVGTYTGSGDTVPIDQELLNPENYTFTGNNNQFLVYCENPGSWNKDVGIRILNYDERTQIFTLEVCYLVDNEWQTVATYNVSFDDKKNEWGQNIGITTINTKSMVIRIKKNENYSGSKIPAYTNGVVQIIRGSNGDAVTDAEIIRGWDLFRNKEQYQIGLLINAGQTSPAVQKNLINICEQRQDCIAVLDVPKGLNVNEASFYAKSDLNADTSYAALFYPWLKDYDKYNDKYIDVPPSAYYSAGAAYLDSILYPWYTVAGEGKGECIGAVGIERILTDDDRAILEESKINPIRFIAGKGIYIWGNSTLQTKKTARQKLHIRRLLIYIETNIMKFLESFVFEFNDEFTRSTITFNLNTFLEDIKNKRGLYDYKVVCDSSNNTPDVIDRDELMVDIYLQPVRVIEKILLRVVITRTGASFSEITL